MMPPLKMMPPGLQYAGWYIPFLLRDVFRLACFVIALSPGFLRFFWYYVWTSHRIVRRYGNKSWRQSLDVYLPIREKQQDGLLAPVVVFYTGGAWVIGYKMWGALMARALTAAGIVVVIPDYRNYPCARVPHMVQDVESSLKWVKLHIREHGGDSNKIVIVGQSAGGHLACTWLLKRAVELSSSEQDGGAKQHQCEEKVEEINGPLLTTRTTELRPTDFKGFISLSAPYDLNAMQSTFHRHGLDEDIVDRVFDSQGNDYTPSQILDKWKRRTRTTSQSRSSLSTSLPPILIMHGTNDKTVPYHGSKEFYQQLLHYTTNIDFTTYQGWSHTDGILEMPMNANHRFHKDVFDSVQHWTNSPELIWPQDDPIIANRLCPRYLIKWGQSANPF